LCSCVCVCVMEACLLVMAVRKKTRRLPFASLLGAQVHSRAPGLLDVSVQWAGYERRLKNTMLCI